MDNYTVLRVIGHGSFGSVLLATEKSSNQTFAMKEIRLLKSFSDVQNCRKEAVLLAKMKHPNIVAFKEFFEAEGHLYIVMEYCDGGDLTQRIKQQKGKLFPEDTVLNWFIQICLGVNHIHKRRVLHRDIKSKIIREYGEQILDEVKISKPQNVKKQGNPPEPPRNASPASPHRQRWERHGPSSAVAALEKASILTSSFTAEDDRGGSVIKYSEENARRQWVREPPEALLSMLKGADLSLAFQTYTIHRPGTEGFLKGPLSEDTASDSVDGDLDSVLVDPERFEPRLDEEDTDFEEDDENPDWVSELKKQVGQRDVGGEQLLGERVGETLERN